MQAVGGSCRGTEHARILHRAPSPPPLPVGCNVTSSAAENIGAEITRYNSRPGRLGNHYFLLFFIACDKKPRQEPRCEAASCRGWRLCWGRESRDLSASSCLCPALPASRGHVGSLAPGAPPRGWQRHSGAGCCTSHCPPCTASALHPLMPCWLWAMLLSPQIFTWPLFFVTFQALLSPGRQSQSRATCDESPAPAPSLPPPR